MSNKLKYVQRFQQRAHLYKKQFASITILTAVMMFGFQNCAKAPMSFESDKLATASLKGTDAGIVAGTPQIAIGDASAPADSAIVTTQIVCEAGGMFVDPVAGHCPEGSVDVSAGSGSSGGSAVDSGSSSGGTTDPTAGSGGGSSDSGSSVVTEPAPGVDTAPVVNPSPSQPPSSDVIVDLPADDAEVAVDASGSQISDLGECLVPEVVKHLHRNLKLKIVLHLPFLNIGLKPETLVSGWLDGILNSLRKENGSLLSIEERKDILARLRLSSATPNLPDIDRSIQHHHGQGFFKHPVFGVIKVSSAVKFRRGAVHGHQCEGLESIRPKVRIKVHFHGIAQALKVHRHHGDHAEDVLENFQVEVDKDSHDADDKILSVDLEQLSGVSKLRLSCDRH